MLLINNSFFLNLCYLPPLSSTTQYNVTMFTSVHVQTILKIYQNPSAAHSFTNKWLQNQQSVLCFLLGLRCFCCEFHVAKPRCRLCQQEVCIARCLFQDKKSDSPKPTAPLTMEIDPHLRQLQEQAKMFSRFNSVPGAEPEPEPDAPEKEPRKFSL